MAARHDQQRAQRVRAVDARVHQVGYFRNEESEQPGARRDDLFVGWPYRPHLLGIFLGVQRVYTPHYL